jgi:hypothetical protein
MRFLLITLFLTFSVFRSFGQNTGIVRGTVTNELGERLEKVNVQAVETKTGTSTDSLGNYQLVLPANKEFHLRFSFQTLIPKTVVVEVGPGEMIVRDVMLKINSLGTVEISGERPRIEPMEKLPPIKFSNMASVTGNFEDLLKSQIGVRSNNEMSAQYSVRGGNFDENLVYVNDIEIYRPLLVRNGQQEGLSFINPDLVKEVRFSAGGFEAKYGDKMSSVLDITYRIPDSTEVAVTASLMGGSVYFGHRFSPRVSLISGVRYRKNTYILGALPTKGDYRPVFGDGQFLLRFQLNEYWELSAFGYMSDNTFAFVPSTRETDFGTVNQALRLKIYFDGQEITRFRNYMGALSTSRLRERMVGESEITRKTMLKFIASAYFSEEAENYDIQGQYRLSELERDLGSENFGEESSLLGVGTFLNHARNELNALVYNFAHNGYVEKGKHRFLWGMRYQGEIIQDKISEWNLIDSAGYSVPQFPSNEIVLDYVLKTKINLSSNRVQAYVQHSWSKIRLDSITMGDSSFVSVSAFDFNAGVRGNYWDFSNQTVFSPRASVSWKPSWFRMKKGKVERVNVILGFRTGIYYQPPFYRELRDLNGDINYDIRAQRSIHFVLGGDYFFNMWGRPFKFTTELYYKKLDYLIPYEVDNVRIRYYSFDQAKGYAAGWDFKLNGEFIKGIESWASMGFLRTYEDIANDDYYTYYNSDGEEIIEGYTFNNVAVDSSLNSPGYIPRPTDQIFNFGLFFQDEMPQWPSFKVHLSLLFGTPLPYGKPGGERYDDVLRTPSYRRVDVGFSKAFLQNKSKLKPGSFFQKMDELVLSLEVFNLLGINNTISYLWVEDVSGRQYSVPNYLTSRRVNLKLTARF